MSWSAPLPSARAVSSSEQRVSFGALDQRAFTSRVTQLVPPGPCQRRHRPRISSGSSSSSHSSRAAGAERVLEAIGVRAAGQSPSGDHDHGPAAPRARRAA